MKGVSRNEKRYNKNILITNSKDSKILMPSDVVKTWENGFLDKIQRDGLDEGLRLPQFGALSAIRSRWTIKNDPITIVLPTGERVIIVTGYIITLVSRVSGTFIKNNSALLRVLGIMVVSSA